MKNRIRDWAGFLILFLVLGGQAHGDINFNLSVDTSSVVNQDGFIDIQFNPTGGTSPLVATVSLVQQDNSNYCPVQGGYPVGDVTGNSFPFIFKAMNGQAAVTNEILLSINYQTLVAMNLGIATVDSTSTASFFVSLIVPSASNPGEYEYFSQINPSMGPGNNYNALQIDLVANPLEAQPFYSIHAGPQANAFATPEPSTWILLSEGLTGYCLIRLSRKIRWTALAS